MDSLDRQAARISRITQGEPSLLFQSPAEIRRALLDDRAVVLAHGDEIDAFLFFHPYGRWAEVGTGWVAPGLRRQGVFVRMHEGIFQRLQARGLRAFGFPGNSTVERAMMRIGFRRARISEVPWATWFRFVAARIRARKILSYLRGLRAGTHRTSTHLYILGRGADV